ncbi:hypothetical protein D1007_46481 [Hordeum vulgare]|nr:hypothetical protein D1007_46481 [Hordeum vulgare]
MSAEIQYVNNCSFQLLRTDDDGVLGLAVKSKLGIHIWERKLISDGVTGWVLLQKINQLEGISCDAFRNAEMVGYDEELNVVVLFTHSGDFMAEELGGNGWIQISEHKRSVNVLCRLNSWARSRSLQGGGGYRIWEGDDAAARPRRRPLPPQSLHHDAGRPFPTPTARDASRSPPTLAAQRTLLPAAPAGSPFAPPPRARRPPRPAAKSSPAAPPAAPPPRARRPPHRQEFPAR